MDGVWEVALGIVSLRLRSVCIFPQIQFPWWKWVGPPEGRLGTYTDDWLLALDAGAQLRLLDVHDQVSALEVSGNGEADGEVADRLRPLVWKSSLLRLFARTRYGFGGLVCGGILRALLADATHGDSTDGGVIWRLYLVIGLIVRSRRAGCDANKMGNHT